MFPQTAGAGNQQAWSKFLRSAKKAMVPYSANDSASAVPGNTAMSDAAMLILTNKLITDSEFSKMLSAGPAGRDSTIHVTPVEDKGNDNEEHTVRQNKTLKDGTKKAGDMGSVKVCQKWKSDAGVMNDHPISMSDTLLTDTDFSKMLSIGDSQTERTRIQDTNRYDGLDPGIDRLDRSWKPRTIVSIPAFDNDSTSSCESNESLCDCMSDAATEVDVADTRSARLGNTGPSGMKGQGEKSMLRRSTENMLRDWVMLRDPEKSYFVTQSQFISHFPSNRAEAAEGQLSGDQAKLKVCSPFQPHRTILNRSRDESNKPLHYYPLNTTANLNKMYKGLLVLCCILYIFWHASAVLFTKRESAKPKIHDVALSVMIWTSLRWYIWVGAILTVVSCARLVEHLTSQRTFKAIVDACMPRQSGSGGCCVDPPTGKNAPIQLIMTLVLDLSIAGSEGSDKRAKFKRDIADDLATASGLPSANFTIKKVFPGSIILDMQVMPDPLTPRTHLLTAKDLANQAVDTSSKLRSGKITSHAIGVKVIASKSGEVSAYAKKESGVGDASENPELTWKTEDPTSQLTKSAPVVKKRAAKSVRSASPPAAVEKIVSQPLHRDISLGLSIVDDAAASGALSSRDTHCGLHASCSGSSLVQSIDGELDPKVCKEKGSCWGRIVGRRNVALAATAVAAVIVLVAVVVNVRARPRRLRAPSGEEGSSLLQSFGSSRMKALLKEEARHKTVTEDDLLRALEEEVGPCFFTNSGKTVRVEGLRVPPTHQCLSRMEALLMDEAQRRRAGHRAQPGEAMRMRWRRSLGFSGEQQKKQKEKASRRRWQRVY